MEERMFYFSPFRLDLTNQQLWRENTVIPLRPKPFAVLRHLVEQQGRLVPKTELLRAIWPGTVVSEGVLKGYIRQLRVALGDDAKAPRFIETVERRGYRLLSTVTITSGVGKQHKAGDWGLRTDSFLSSPNHKLLAPSLVGRKAELSCLHQLFARALHGEREVVFVTGEPGIGKTALIDAFVSQVKDTEGLWITSGQCIEHYGPGEPYLPMLEALASLCQRSTANQEVLGVLRRYAPTWALQLPAFLLDEEVDRLRRRVHGATRARMLREMAAAVEALTAAHPLLLILEDLQWSDSSTVDLLSLLAQRTEPARLFVLGAYRPADVLLSHHPLKAVRNELHLHKRCETLALQLLREEGVTRHLDSHFAPHRFPPAFSRLIHQHTEGNPLFMMRVLEDFIAQGVVDRDGDTWALRFAIDEVKVRVPESLRQLIEKQFARLTHEEQRLLEIASVAGAEFSTAAVAAVFPAEEDWVEDCCAGLARRGQFLQPNGVEIVHQEIVGRYRFAHALYRRTLYEQLSVAYRVRLHRRLGEHQEFVRLGRTPESAAELGLHFLLGGKPQRALPYLLQAAEAAARKHVPRESVSHLTRALQALEMLPTTAPARSEYELIAQSMMCAQLALIHGYSSPDVEQAYVAARNLCGRMETSRAIAPVLLGLCRLQLLRADLRAARELADGLLCLMTQIQDTAVRLAAHTIAGVISFWRGDFTVAHRHLETGLSLYDAAQHHTLTTLYADDPGVVCGSTAALTLWARGYPDQALCRMRLALRFAQQCHNPYGRSFALFFAAVVHLYRREHEASLACAEATLQLAREHGFPLFEAGGLLMQGKARIDRGEHEVGMAELREASAAWQETGATITPHILTLVAEALGQTGQEWEAMTMVETALAQVSTTEHRECEAELYRLRGEFKLRRFQASSPLDEAFVNARTATQPTPTEIEAEADFRCAIDIARRQGAKSWELRATTSLSRLWLRQGKIAQARQTLGETYAWFTEGFDTYDLRQAQQILTVPVC